MAKLTKKQIKYLERYKIPLSSMFDASGMKRADYRVIMELTGKFFAYGVTPCGSAGHTIRTKRGLCIECFPAGIGYLKNYHKNKYLYIAASRTLKLLKIGVANTPEDRIREFNFHSPGGASDWSVLCSLQVSDAGPKETEIHRRLLDYVRPVEYTRTGVTTIGKECFSTTYSFAKDVLLQQVPESERNQLIEANNAIDYDSFYKKKRRT